LGLPHIPEPTDEDVNKWHLAYVKEVVRLFNSYKAHVPEYKDKHIRIK
jgi:hypothetical protein